MSDYIERTKKLIERYTELRKEYMSQRALEKERVKYVLQLKH